MCKPRDYLLSLFSIGVAIALVYQGVTNLNDSVGGAIPFTIIFGGAVISIYCTWHFLFRKLKTEN